MSTLTVYPDAGTGNTTIDGYCSAGDGSTNVDWSALTGGAGDSANDTGSNVYLFDIRCGDTSNKYTLLARALFTFDTSALTSGATISGAVLSICGYAKADTLSATGNCDIYTSAPASNNDLVAGDFDSLGTTSQTGSPIAYASLKDDGTYTDFTFNATGIGNISKTGISKFGTRNANYDVANSAPTWSSTRRNYWLAHSADYEGTDYDPKLVITYSTTTAYTAEVTDTLAMVSSDTQAQALLSTIINNLVLSETQTDNSQFNQSATDNLSLSDTNTNQIDRGAIVNDNLGLSETESNETKFNQAFSETLANEETTTWSIAFISNIEETIKGTESIGIITQFLSSVSDALAMMQELWGDWWEELSKHSTSWTQSSKNTTSYTQQSKNTTSWTQETKNKTNTKLG